jgi:small subunit ribosomal protein S17e
LNNDLGKVRPEKVKKIAKELLKRYPDKFSIDFESNKKALASLLTASTVKLRNRIAGYVTRQVAIAKAAEKAQAEETEETAEEDEEE